MMMKIQDLLRKKKAQQVEKVAKPSPKKNKKAEEKVSEEEPAKKPRKKKEKKASSENEDAAAPKPKRAPKRKRGSEEDEKQAKTLAANQRRFQQYFTPCQTADLVAPRIMKTEVTTVKKEEEGGWMVFSDVKKVVEDKEAQARVLEHLKKGMRSKSSNMLSF